MRKTWKCALCGVYCVGFGNNPAPVDQVYKTDLCCDICNDSKVIPERLRRRKQAMNI